jgi:hypothetical protein
MQAPTRRPPLEPPLMERREGVVYPCEMRYSAAAMKSSKPFYTADGGKEE